jgi:DNA-directed RNA polymerase beta subunit
MRMLTALGLVGFSGYRRQAAARRPSSALQRRERSSIVYGFNGKSTIWIRDEMNPLTQTVHGRKVSCLGPGGLTGEL